MEPTRPDPDALLAQVSAAEERERRGKLKVFLGAAPGVGKTYAMLSAARELRTQGRDVVVGVVETHGRRETEALLEGLEVVPRQRLDYKGRALEELDLDALLRRRPAVALVDELAHSNAPGARHQRRYQDVAELLDAGIDVYTTVNVQHLESLNDVVEQITGIRVRETVPDAFLDRLRDIVLIDLPPRELIERLRQGKVYVPEQARTALQAYFSPSNLAALRELAMQAVAERVDSDLREAHLAQAGPAGAPLRRRVLVAVDGHEHTEYLVRVARRVAEQRQAPWTVVHVDTGNRRTDRDRLSAAFQLARRLGGATAVLRGTSVAEEIVEYARRQGVSSILLGQTRERPIARLFGRSITQRLLRGGARFDLTIVDTPFARVRSRRRRERERLGAEQALELASATAVTAAAVALAAGLERLLPVHSLGLIFLVAVLAVAVRAGRAVALYAAVVSFLAYNFFFTEPRLTFRISHAEDVVAVLSFLAAALVCSHLAARQRAQVVMLRAANEHTHALQALGERLAAAVDEGQVFQAGCEELAAALGCEAVALLREGAEGGTPRQVGAQPRTPRLAANDLAAADWVAGHAKPAGRYTDTLSASPWWFVPLIVERGCLGAVGLRFPASLQALADEQRRLAEAMIQQMALTADRAHLAADLEAAHVESETERLRSALLSSVSHDLRSPLAAVIGAASSLLAFGETMPAQDRRELLESIRSEGERLDRYIQNLLDMTRLGSGTLKLQRDWVSPEEVVSSAITRLRKVFTTVKVESRVGGGLPLLFVHPALIEQALFNVLENAARFSPPGAEVVVAAETAGGKLILDVTDRGPGIPEESRRRIFDMFFTTAQGDRGAHGTGLGLAIVRGMVGAHGGRVEALPGPHGVGTTVRLTLPLPEPPRPDVGDEEG